MIEDSEITYRVGKTGMYEAFPAGEMSTSKARIGWNTGESGKICEVFISDDIYEWRARSRGLLYSGGDCYRDWCVPVKERDGQWIGPDQVYDPLGTFASMMSIGFVSRRVFREALKQFARMKDCAWARRMLHAFDGEWSERDLDQPL